MQAILKDIFKKFADTPDKTSKNIFAHYFISEQYIICFFFVKTSVHHSKQQ